ncbi:hypothetical protein TWF225_011138 [Orbilia oligospora]|nr:hypothetical protein TWF225_011138 [Orbilia oligospora]KAF3248532.1 hypothetical protein TWF217_009130 [Orbilia oligospora]KAF3251318.1 hypothetical protein TWF128_007319 [Orbilia oligospora]
MTTSSSSIATSGKSSQDIEKRLQILFAEGQSFLKSSSVQLQYMSDHGLLDKGGKRVQKHIQKYQDVQLGSKAVIAFIGESGAGKSTLLNALLDRENIVPTSGIRACTSVATEFSSRTTTMKSQFYAVIEFVKREEFEKEVEILRYDITGEDGTQFDTEDGYCMLSASEDEENKSNINIPTFKRRRLSDSSSSAAATVARDKMKALFPGFQDCDLLKISEMVKDLYDGAETLSVGQQIIESDDEDEFVEQVHQMIANRGDDEDTEPQLWPLIKIMRIHLDAEVLDGDAILVDLPGLKDDNAARAAVAQSYLAKANEVIIVSRLARALTDETTAALAEMGYTKQLQFDGRRRITILFRPNDARQEFKNVKGFCANYDELSKRVKAIPSRRELKNFSTDEQKKFKKEAEEANKELRELCFKTRDEQVPILLSRVYGRLLGGNIKIKSFLVASKEYQDHIEKFGDELDDEEFAVVKRTQIPQLRDYCIKIPIEQKVHRTKFFINSVWRAFGAARFLVEDLGTSLSQNIRENICTDLEKAATSMQKGLVGLQQKCSENIDKTIAEIVENTDTYRAVCRRHGEWKLDSKNLNQRFLQTIDEGLAKIWNPSMAKIQKSLSEYTSKLDKQLTVFERRWESIIYQHCPAPPEELQQSMKTILNSLNAMSVGTQKLSADQIQKVNDQQREINREFTSTGRIKEAMRATYDFAGKEFGPGSYGRMIDAVSDGIEKTDVFNEIKDAISLGLRDLEKTLNEENIRWCQDIGEELETNIKNWISLSDKVEQAEIEEKAKLKVIISKFEPRMKNLLSDTTELEAQL